MKNNKSQFHEALALLRMFSSGVVMSIEKNQRELIGLERLLQMQLGFPHVALFSSLQGAIHAGLIAKSYKHGDFVTVDPVWTNTPVANFLKYLGFTFVHQQNGLTQHIGPHMFLDINDWNGQSFKSEATLILDLSSLGYGSAAAYLTRNALERKVAERLKIFGEHDLQIMWEKKAIPLAGPATVQFNYRLSPVVAGLIRAQWGGNSERFSQKCSSLSNEH